MFSKKRKLGRSAEMLKIGEKYEMEKKIEDKDILLFLGITDDANPIYIQHDYAARTPFQKPIVPNVMLIGFVSSAVSMHLPGPGSCILEQSLSFPKPVYHYGIFKLVMEVTEVAIEDKKANISILGRDEYDEVVVKGHLVVGTPYPSKPMTHDSGTFENF